MIPHIPRGGHVALNDTLALHFPIHDPASSFLPLFPLPTPSLITIHFCLFIEHLHYIVLISSCVAIVPVPTSKLHTTPRLFTTHRSGIVLLPSNVFAQVQHSFFMKMGNMLLNSGLMLSFLLFSITLLVAIHRELELLLGMPAWACQKMLSRPLVAGRPLSGKYMFATIQQCAPSSSLLPCAFGS